MNGVWSWANAALGCTCVGVDVGASEVCPNGDALAGALDRSSAVWRREYTGRCGLSSLDCTRERPTRHHC